MKLKKENYNMNAREEFLSEITHKKVKCAVVDNGYIFEDKEVKYLKIGYTKDEFYDFLNSLNFDYDDSYGEQYLSGTIWYEDGTWSERAEYDGSEWWKYKKCPEINEKLKEV